MFRILLPYSQYQGKKRVTCCFGCLFRNGKSCRMEKEKRKLPKKEKTHSVRAIHTVRWHTTCVPCTLECSRTLANRMNETGCRCDID